MPGPYALGVAIEGVGSDTSKSDGIAWYRGESGAFSGSDYEWIGGPGSPDGMLGPDPLILDSSVNPFTCDLRVASITATVAYTATSAPLLLYEQTITRLSLAASIDHNDATVSISGTGSTGLANSVVWLADEAVLLGTHTGGGTYTGCTRSFWGCTGVTHLLGESVYTKNNRLPDRLVRLLRYDHSDDTEEEMYRGYVRGGIEGSDDGTTITIPTVEIWTMLRETKINSGAPDLGRVSSIRLQRIAGESKWRPRGQISHSRVTLGHSKRVAKPGDAAHIQAYQAGDALIWGDYSDTALSNSPGVAFDAGTTREFTGGPVDRSEFTRETIRGPFGGSKDWIELQPPVYELFAVLRDLDEDDASLGTNFSATRDLTYPFHPGEISMALLTSTRGAPVVVNVKQWDCLGHRWSAQLLREWTDANELSNVFDATSGMKIDRLVLGWDGEEVDVWPLCKLRLWLPYGLYPVTTETGLLLLARFGEAGVLDWVNASSITAEPFTLKWDPARSSTVQTITGKVGGWPWQEGEPFTVNALDYATAEPTESLRSSRRFAELDYSTKTDRAELIEELTVELQRRHLAMPRLTLAAGPGTYRLGDYYRLNSPDVTLEPGGGGWLIDSDGNMISVSTGVFGFIGPLIGRRHNVDEDSYRLMLLLTNFKQNDLPRLYSASGEVASYSAGPPIRITFANTAYSSNDAAKFTVDDQVEIWKADNSLRSGTPGVPDIQEIDAVGANFVDLKFAFTTPPQAGDILELSILGGASGYPVTGNPNGPTPGLLGYCYLAESDETLGPTDIAAHIYSTKRVL